MFEAGGVVGATHHNAQVTCTVDYKIAFNKRNNKFYNNSYTSSSLHFLRSSL